MALINEEFVTQLIRSYLFSDHDSYPILNNQKEVVDNFVETMLYFLNIVNIQLKIGSIPKFV